MLPVQGYCQGVISCNQNEKYIHIEKLGASTYVSLCSTSKLVYASTYQYVLVYTGTTEYTYCSQPQFISIRHDQPCCSDECLLYACSAPAGRLHSWLQSHQLSDHPGEACFCQSSQIAKAKGLPHTHCCHTCHCYV